MAKYKRLKPIGDYLYDKGEMIEHMFSSIPIVEIRNMVPMKLQGMPLHELKAECLVELLGISDREILNILDGKKERNVSSSDSEQGAFVISDEERKKSEKRIKKGKKDTVRKIKTERISSKKDGTSRSSEPSTSKKKRKSKEIVEVNSKKKKKSDDKPANIPSSSRDASKVPVIKKKKGKKEEKKKDSSKKKEEDDEIVVLDDDSDKEEKRGQKSLLDLLELEMRARAIRSLLKKEEAVQAQKILSDYKDEPDDLIPIDIEPPQIELLSDSEGEETANAVDLEAHKNTSTEKKNEGISSKQPEGSLQSVEDRKQYSRSPNGYSHSVSCAIEKMATSDSSSEILNKNTSKSTNEIEGQAAKIDSSGPGPVVMKDCEKNDEAPASACKDHDDTIQSNVPGVIISDEAREVPGSSGSASQCSSASKLYTISCDPTGKSLGSDSTVQDARKIDSSLKPEKSHCISSSAKDSGTEIDTGNFLVIEEPSIVQVTDGSQIKESIIEANNSSVEIMKASSNLDSDRDQNTCSIGNVDCLTVQEEFQQPTAAESSQIDSNSDIANEENAVDNSDPNFIESSPEKGGNCEVHVEGNSGCSNTSGANLTLHTPTEKYESTDRSSVEDGSHSQFEDEVLDYDYNPVSSYCEKESDASISPLENSPSCGADKTVGNSSGDYHFSSVSYPNCNDGKKNEKKQNNLESSAHKVSNDCEIFEPGTNSRTDWPENSDANLVHPSDLPLEETASNTCSLAENLGGCTLENDTNQKSPSKVDIFSRNQLETVELKEEGRPSDFSSPKLLEDSEPVALVSMSMTETKVSYSIQESDWSNKANDRLSKVEADPENAPKNIHTHEKERHSCLNIKPPVDVAIEEQAGSPEQNQMTTEQDLTLQLPGFYAGSSGNITTINTVTDELLVLVDNISNSGKVEIPQNSSVRVPASGFTGDLLQQTSLTNSERDEKPMVSEPYLLPFRSDDDSDAVISTVTSKQTIEIPIDCNLSPNTNGEIIESVQNPECKSSVISTSYIVECSNSISSQILEPLVLSTDLEILDKANELEVPNSSGTDANTLGSYETQHPYSQDLINANVAEIIDITEQEPIDSSEVVFVSEERVDPDSIDESDNEMSDKAALILEQMNNILNDDVCKVGGSGQPSPQATSVVPVKVYAVNSNSGSSEPATDEEDADDGLPDDDTVLAVSDLDDASEEETQDEETSDTNGSESSLDKGSIEIIDDSDSVCSVESQRDDSKSDDCVMVLQPQGSVSDDCIIVTEPDISINSNIVVSTEPEGSESDDCAIISQHNDAILDERVHISDKEVPCVKATGSMSSEIPSTPTDKDSVMVTIIIEDDEGEEEEVKLLTEDVPAEILELGDDDEAKTSWTARWLESDNVKKVVQTSKILTNVRKQMKMKLKKIEAPVANDLKLPEGKSAPPLIGSVEEYHRLVKEGVIFSKASQKHEKTESSNNPITDSVGLSKESTDTVSAESKAQKGHDEQSHKDKTGKKKKSDKCERKKHLEKSERKRKSDKYKKKKSDEFSAYPNKVPELSPSPGAKETDTHSKSNEKLEVLNIGKVVAEDTVREEGVEMIESSYREVPDCVRNPKAGNETDEKIMDNVFEDRVCHTELSAKEGFRKEREEGETSEKEEGEISDSDCDGRESQKSSQPEPSSALKTTSGSKECSRSVSPLSSIPLPEKPPTKQLTTQHYTNRLKQQSSKTPTKTPDRNSAAKRFIIRNLQLGRKRPANSKNKKNKKKKKKKKGAGLENKKGLAFSPNAAPDKNKPSSKSQMKGTYKNPISETEVESLASASNSLQTVQGIQPSYLATYSGLSQSGSSMSQLGSAQNTTVNVSNSTQMYDSYYSWAYSQGLISSASSNYGYGTPESTPDPNVYKQWEEYYRKLMEACKVSAEHASAGSLYNFSSASTTEKSGYTWLFDHSKGTSQTEQVQQTSADSTTEPVAQVQAPGISSETSEVSQSVVPLTNEMSEKDRFKSWQYRYGLKGLLKEHFIAPPTAPSTGDGNQKS